jgi:hypothetical protein
LCETVLKIAKSESWYVVLCDFAHLEWETDKERGESAPNSGEARGGYDNDILFANMKVYPILMFTIIHTMIDQY